MADHTDLGSGKAADAVEDGRQLRARLLGQLVAVEQEVEQEAARRHRTRRQGVAPGRLDLRAIDRLRRARRCARAADLRGGVQLAEGPAAAAVLDDDGADAAVLILQQDKIGSASCRERVCQYV